MFFVVKLTSYAQGEIVAGPFRTSQEAVDWVAQNVEPNPPHRHIVVHRERK